MSKNITKRYTQKDGLGQTILSLVKNGYYCINSHIDDDNRVHNDYITGDFVDRFAELENEAEKREKGCSFCNDNKYFRNIGVASRMRICQNIDGKFILEVDDEDIEIAVCPFCGRELNKPINAIDELFYGLSIGDVAYYIFNHIPSGKLDISKCEITEFKHTSDGVKIVVDDAVEFDEQDIGKYLFCGEKAEKEAVLAVIRLQTIKRQSPIFKGKKDKNKEENS